MKRIAKVGGQYLGTKNHDGSRYRYYRNKHAEWDQFWAVREQYRTSGPVSLRPVLDMWRKGGMENRIINTIRMNFECSKKISGSLQIKDVRFPNELVDKHAEQ